MPVDPIKALGLSEDPRFVPASSRDSGFADGAGVIMSENPTTGQPIAGVRLESSQHLDRTIRESVEAFKKWREVPAPFRGQIVRAIGDEFRRHRDPLGELVSLEMGKIRAEGI